jgi:hypothetical protein
VIKTMKMRFAVDRRGKITSGEKGTSSTGKEIPKSLDHFNVDKFPELANAYGDKPKELTLYFPGDTITDFFDCEFNTYSSANTKIRSCNGEECIHRIQEEINGATYAAGEAGACVCQTMSPDDKKRCKYVAYLRAWIGIPQPSGAPKIDNTLCYLFMTHSQNSGDAIYSELKKIELLNHGILRGIPFKISVHMAAGKMNAKEKFPIWSLEAIGTVTEIQRKGQAMIDAQRKQLT